MWTKPGLSKGSNRGAAHALKKAKREEAEIRNAWWLELTPKEQLQALDRRLGKGVGAAKQRARIAKASESK